MATKLTGKAGKAVQVDHAAIRRQLGPDWKPGMDATLRQWFIEAPGQSTAWRHYMLTLYHLRDIENTPPAHREYAAAEYELVLFAMDPDLNPSANDVQSWAFLRPRNFVGQFHGMTDEQAQAICDFAAKAIVDGELWAEAPLSGQREPWTTWLRGMAPAERAAP